MPVNERDFKIIEAMVICAGALVLTTILTIFYFYGIPFDGNIIVVIFFVFFTTFFFGLFFHFKRRQMVKEFEKIIEEAKNG